MLRTMSGFFRGLLTLAWPWWIWVGLLVAVNGIVPLFFLGSREARWVLAALLVGAVVQMAVFRLKGFVRLLGLGHIAVWVPLLPWLWGRLGALGTDSPFGKWVFAVIVLDGVSLLIDVTDVIRYALGDREPALSLRDD